MIKKAVLLAAFFPLALPAYADADTAAVKISTLGLGFDVATPMAQSVDARIGLNAYNYNYNRTVASGGLSAFYDGRLSLRSLEALADWHPWDSGFRISGGLIFNNNKLTMNGVTQGGTINIGGTTHVVAAGQGVTAKVDFRKVSPYLGVGWGASPKSAGFSFQADLGVMFQGSPRTSVTTNIPTVTAANLAQANADLSNSLKNFRYYPVVSIGIGYTF